MKTNDNEIYPYYCITCFRIQICIAQRRRIYPSFFLTKQESENTLQFFQIVHDIASIEKHESENFKRVGPALDGQEKSSIVYKAK